MVYQSLAVLLLVLETEKEYIEAAKRNDVETMKLLGRAVNVNAKNVVCQ